MHSIHLRHPWQCESVGDVIVWSRKFNWPAELDASEAVQLVVEKLPALARVTLNDSELGTASSVRFDVTSLLASHNSVTISLAGDDSIPTERFPYEVRLDIVAA
ncbi:MAG: hypothetical protein AAGD11_05480 [Planctomycetota bacterium]